MAFQLSFAVYITSVKTASYSDIHLKYRKNLQGFHFLANGVLESQAKCDMRELNTTFNFSYSVEFTGMVLSPSELLKKLEKFKKWYVSPQ